MYGPPPCYEDFVNAVDTLGILFWFDIHLKEVFLPLSDIIMECLGGAG